MNKTKLKHRLVFKGVIQKKLSEPGGLKHRRDSNYIPPDSAASQDSDFSDIFNVGDDLNDIQPSNNLYNEVFQEKKEDSDSNN